MLSREELEFLRESNNIESEHDDISLQDAILAWQYCRKQRHLSIGTVLIVHRLLMESRATLGSKDKGFFRDGQVWVGGREGKPFYALNNLVENWIIRVNDLITRGKKEDTIGNESTIKYHHIQYEGIHPFFDGNGRTGRIFMNWERVKMGLPILIIHTGIEQLEYYKWFSDLT